jgi:hypothetical protein
MNRFNLILILVIPIIAFITPFGFAVVDSEESVTVSFEFPNGAARQATLTDNEVRQLLGRNFGYMVEWWVNGALAKLGLQFHEKVVNAKTGAMAIVAIEGAANSKDGVWTYYVNGYRSKYHINTQLREGVKSIRFVYEKIRK